MSLISHETVAAVDGYSLENELLDLDDDDQRDEYDNMRKHLRRHTKHSKNLRIPRENILEVTKTAHILHVAAGSNVVAVINSQNKIIITDATDGVQSGTYDIPQMLAQAGDHSRRFFPGDRPSRLFLDPLGRQIVVSFDKNSAALHLVLKPVPREGQPQSAGNPTKHYFELKGAGSSGDSGAPCVESIGWCPWNTFPASSGPLVIGSRSGGQIWGARLESSGVVDIKRLFVLGNERAPITSVVQDRSRDSAEARFLTIYCATASTLYIFYGRGSPDSLFSQVVPDAVHRADFVSTTGGACRPARQLPEGDTIALAIQCQLAPGVPKPHRPTQVQSCQTGGFCSFWYSHSAEQQGLGGQWMWTHKDGVSFGSLSPPGFPGAPVLHGTIPYQSLADAAAADEATAAAGGGAASSAGGQQRARGRSMAGGGQHKHAVRVYSSTICAFGMFISTESGMTALIHPACLPWKTDPAGAAAAGGVGAVKDRNRRYTISSLTAAAPSMIVGGGAAGAGAGASSGGIGGGMSSGSLFGSPAGSAAGGGAASDGGHGSDAVTEMLLATTRRAASTATSNHNLSERGHSNNGNNNNNRGKTNQNADDSAQQLDHTALSIHGAVHAGDVKERTFHRLDVTSAFKDVLRAGGGFGAVVDSVTSKIYIFNPLELFELHVPSLRRQVFPLFLENILDMSAYCTMQLRQSRDFAGRMQALRGCEFDSRTFHVSETHRLGFPAGHSVAARNRAYSTATTMSNAASVNNNQQNSNEQNSHQVRSGGGGGGGQQRYSSNQQQQQHQRQESQNEHHNQEQQQKLAEQAALEVNRAAVASFLHAIHMCRTVAGKNKQFAAVIARHAGRIFSQMGAYSCAAPLIADAHAHISVTEAYAVLAAPRCVATVGHLRNDEIAILERDRLLAYEIFGRQSIARMNESRREIGQFRAEIYSLVHFLVLVMVERCRRAEAHEESVLVEMFGAAALRGGGNSNNSNNNNNNNNNQSGNDGGVNSPNNNASFGSSSAGAAARRSMRRHQQNAQRLSPADVHEIEVALQYCTEEAANAVAGARSAVRDMTSEQLPRMTVFRTRRQSVIRSRVSSMGSVFGDAGGGGDSGAGGGASAGGGAASSSAGGGNNGAYSINLNNATVLTVLSQSLCAFVQHHLNAGNLSFRVVERAILAAASPKLASLVFVIMREFGVVLRNLIARGNFTAAARVLSSYCLSAQSHKFWRLHSNTLMAHCPLEYLTAEFVDNVGNMNFVPEDLVCMLAPAAYHQIKYAGRDEHTHMCRSVVAVLRAYLNSSNENHKSPVLEKQTVMMMCLHNSDEELVDFISETLETDYLDLEQDEVASRRSSFSGFALRICAKAGRVAGVAEVLFRQGLWFDAVKLLVRSPGFTAQAKDYAVKVPSDEERHKCWFEIVRRSVAADPLMGSNAALEMLNESAGDLSVYDVFPELSEAVSMRALGNGLVKAVNEVAERMHQTQTDVDTARRITHRLRSQADGTRRGIVAVNVDKTCDICQGPLLGAHDELLYYPACGHGVHQSCTRPGGGVAGLGIARERGRQTRTLRHECPLCSPAGLLHYLTAPIELPEDHAAAVFDQ